MAWVTKYKYKCLKCYNLFIVNQLIPPGSTRKYPCPLCNTIGRVEFNSTEEVKE